MFLVIVRIYDIIVICFVIVIIISVNSTHERIYRDSIKRA